MATLGDVCYACLVPGPSPARLNENHWPRNVDAEQNPQVASTHIKIGRLPELGQMRQGMMKCQTGREVM